VVDDGDLDDGVAVGGAEPGRFGVEVDNHRDRIMTFLVVFDQRRFFGRWKDTKKENSLRAYFM
jgi:hypothetical protein